MSSRRWCWIGLALAINRFDLDSNIRQLFFKSPQCGADSTDRRNTLFELLRG